MFLQCSSLVQDKDQCSKSFSIYTVGRVLGTLPSSTNGAEAAAAAAPKATVAVPVAAAAVPPMATRSVEREESSSSASVEREGTSHAAEPMFLEPSFRYISGVCVDDKNRLCITEEDTARLYFYSVGGEIDPMY